RAPRRARWRRRRPPARWRAAAAPPPARAPSGRRPRWWSLACSGSRRARSPAPSTLPRAALPRGASTASGGSRPTRRAPGSTGRAAPGGRGPRAARAAWRWRAPPAPGTLRGTSPPGPVRDGGNAPRRGRPRAPRWPAPPETKSSCPLTLVAGDGAQHTAQRAHRIVARHHRQQAPPAGEQTLTPLVGDALERLQVPAARAPPVRLHQLRALGAAQPQG